MRPNPEFVSAATATFAIVAACAVPGFAPIRCGLPSRPVYSNVDHDLQPILLRAHPALWQEHCVFSPYSGLPGDDYYPLPDSGGQDGTPVPGWFSSGFLPAPSSPSRGCGDGRSVFVPVPAVSNVAVAHRQETGDESVADENESNRYRTTALLQPIRADLVATEIDNDGAISDRSPNQRIEDLWRTSAENAGTAGANGNVHFPKFHPMKRMRSREQIVVLAIRLYHDHQHLGEHDFANSGSTDRFLDTKHVSDCVRHHYAGSVRAFLRQCPTVAIAEFRRRCSGKSGDLCGLLRPSDGLVWTGPARPVKNKFRGSIHVPSFPLSRPNDAEAARVCFALDLFEHLDGVAMADFADPSSYNRYLSVKHLSQCLRNHFPHAVEQFLAHCEHITISQF